MPDRVDDDTTAAAIVHELKVVPPYFDALVSGAKTFEVRKNDRAYQRGDVLRLREWHPESTSSASGAWCHHDRCSFHQWAVGHWSECREIVERRVSFVYAGDPRFGGVEPGYVVLGLEAVSS